MQVTYIRRYRRECGPLNACTIPCQSVTLCTYDNVSSNVLIILLINLSSLSDTRLPVTGEPQDWSMEDPVKDATSFAVLNKGTPMLMYAIAENYVGDVSLTCNTM